MKFSDMMGKGSKAAVDEAETTETAVAPAQRNAPPVPEAPIRFGGNRSDIADETTAPAPDTERSPAPAAVSPFAQSGAPSAPPLVESVVEQPSIAEVMAELTPRVGGATEARASDSELDATAWLEGLSTIDDDLLPR